jgi:hypothetical protein
MNNDKEKMDEFELYWRSNPDLFPEDLSNKLDTYYDIKDFFFNKVLKLSELMAPRLKELMYKQNPEFSIFTHPAVFKFMDDINETNATGLMWQLRGLLKDQKAGIIPNEKYSSIEEWREFYSFPPVADTLPESHRQKYHKRMTDEEWKRYKEREDKAFLQFHNYEEKRKTEYYDIVQPLLFKLLPELENLEGDYWVLYAVEIRDNYDEWKTLCEQLESIAEYNMPQESVLLNDDEFRKLESKAFKEAGYKTVKRNKKIADYPV